MTARDAASSRHLKSAGRSLIVTSPGAVTVTSTRAPAIRSPSTVSAPTGIPASGRTLISPRGTSGGTRVRAALSVAQLS
jgi:hypothetical protein